MSKLDDAVDAYKRRAEFGSLVVGREELRADIKALLIAWDDGVKTFAEIFLPHIVLPGGKTVVQDLLPKYALAVESGQMPDIKLLPGAENETN